MCGGGEAGLIGFEAGESGEGSVDAGLLNVGGGEGIEYASGLASRGGGNADLVALYFKTWMVLEGTGYGIDEGELLRGGLRGEEAEGR